MKILSLYVDGMRLLKDFRLSFTEEGSDMPRQWTLLVGGNAKGKTTVLQAIALAAAGRDAQTLW